MLRFIPIFAILCSAAKLNAQLNQAIKVTGEELKAVKGPGNTIVVNRGGKMLLELEAPAKRRDENGYRLNEYFANLEDRAVQVNPAAAAKLNKTWRKNNSKDPYSSEVWSASEQYLSDLKLIFDAATLEYPQLSRLLAEGYLGTHGFPTKSVSVRFSFHPRGSYQGVIDIIHVAEDRLRVDIETINNAFRAGWNSGEQHISTKLSLRVPDVLAQLQAISVESDGSRWISQEKRHEVDSFGRALFGVGPTITHGWKLAMALDKNLKLTAIVVDKKGSNEWTNFDSRNLTPLSAALAKGFKRPQYNQRWDAKIDAFKEGTGNNISTAFSKGRSAVKALQRFSERFTFSFDL